MRFLNFHAPDRVRVFGAPEGGIRRRDDEALVYDVRLTPDLALRHYSFADRWFEVNCTLDLAGNLVTEPGPIAWCFNCDISTPHQFLGTSAAGNMDLWLDVLVGPDGRQHVVIDEDDFAEAGQKGWLTPETEAGARAGLADLLHIIETQGLAAFLDSVCPFGPMADAPFQPPMGRQTLAEFPALAHVIAEQRWWMK